MVWPGVALKGAASGHNFVKGRGADAYYTCSRGPQCPMSLTDMCTPCVPKGRGGVSFPTHYKLGSTAVAGAPFKPR